METVTIKKYSYSELKRMMKLDNDLESKFYDLLDLCTNEIEEEIVHENLHKIECIDLGEY